MNNHTDTTHDPSGRECALAGRKAAGHQVDSYCKACYLDAVSPLADADVIHVYSRDQAIQDGVLTPANILGSDREHSILESHYGFKREVCLSASLAGPLMVLKPEQRLGRLHDILWMASLAFARAGGRGSTLLPFKVKLGSRVHSLWIELDGDGFTIMHPEDR